MSSANRARLDREQAFHDERFTDDSDRSAARKYYSVTRSSARQMDQLLARLPAGATALELGCGLHNQAMSLAAHGVSVRAVDISPVAVQAMQQRAVEAKLDELVTAQVMNAEELAFDADSFDLVVGTGILHHLDLAAVYPEIARVLRPTGMGAFVEPLGGNALINLYRWLTPRMRTPDEHPLVAEDFELARSWFDQVTVSYFNASTLLAVPFRRSARFDSVLTTLERLDSWCFNRFAVTRSFAWTCVIELSVPTLASA